MSYTAFMKHTKDAGTIADLLIDPASLDLRLRKIKRNPKTTLHCVQASGAKRFDLLPAELKLAWVVKNPVQMEYKLEKVLATIRESYD